MASGHHHRVPVAMVVFSTGPATQPIKQTEMCPRRFIQHWTWPETCAGCGDRGRSQISFSTTDARDLALAWASHWAVMPPSRQPSFQLPAALVWDPWDDVSEQGLVWASGTCSQRPGCAQGPAACVLVGKVWPDRAGQQPAGVWQDSLATGLCPIKSHLRTISARAPSLDGRSLFEVLRAVSRGSHPAAGGEPQ